MPASLPSHSPSAKLPSAPSPAAEQLYQSGLSLIFLCLKRFSFPAEDKEDAEAAARLGLWKAAASFDPAKGFLFSSYATVCIRQTLLNHLKSQQRQTQIPTVSLDAPKGIGADGETRLLADFLPDDPGGRPGAALEADVGFEARIADLSEAQQAVLRALYGEGLSVAEFSRRQGIPVYQAQNAQKSALRTLRRQQGAPQKTGRPAPNVKQN